MNGADWDSCWADGAELIKTGFERRHFIRMVKHGRPSEAPASTRSVASLANSYIDLKNQVPELKAFTNSKDTHTLAWKFEIYKPD